MWYGPDLQPSGDPNKATSNNTSDDGTVSNDIIDKNRAGSALKTDVDHAFSDIVDNYAGYSSEFSIPNGKLYQLGGSYNGIPGRFEWIIQGNQVTHRMFVRGGAINGVPIRRLK